MAVTSTSPDQAVAEAQLTAAVGTLGSAPALPWQRVEIGSALTDWQRVSKRVMDVGLAIVALVILLPVFALVSLTTLVDSGRPIMYRSVRVGERGRLFPMRKFRTMTPDRRQQQVVGDFAERRVNHKTDEDPRVTALGRLLRRTSLDELPQLINVLLGDMSLVGPRPEQLAIAISYEPWQWQRWGVPQGITGLWQIRGRSLRPLYLHTQDDLEYINRYSIWLDLRILLATARSVVTGAGAF